MPCDSIGTELDAWNGAKEVTSYVDGSGLGDDARRTDVDYVEARIPTEALHVNPDSAAKTTGDCTYGGPEVHTLRSLRDTRILEIRGYPVREITTHAQSPQETGDVLIPVGMVSGDS